MRIWLDDERLPPSGTWTWAKTYEEAISLLKNERVEEISFDNDLGEKMEGYDVAKWIEEMAANGAIDEIAWKVHSGNIVGRKNIEAAMRKADSFWQNEQDEEEEEIEEDGEWQ